MFLSAGASAALVLMAQSPSLGLLLAGGTGGSMAAASQLPGLASVLGPSAAGAVAAALGAGAAGPFGITLAVDANMLAVQASGSQAVQVGGAGAVDADADGMGSFLSE